MTYGNDRQGFGAGRRVSGLLMILIGWQMLGCEIDSFFDPSKTGRFEHTATTVPILDRIDVIESGSDLWGSTTDALPQDLIPSDLAYRMAANDLISVQIFELILFAFFAIAILTVMRRSRGQRARQASDDETAGPAAPAEEETPVG